ncbi:hypothetical protein D3C87_1820510 [compost metagenome]
MLLTNPAFPPAALIVVSKPVIVEKPPSFPLLPVVVAAVVPATFTGRVDPGITVSTAVAYAPPPPPEPPFALK